MPNGGINRLESVAQVTMLADIAPGLRERKKRETRERIVTVAFELFQSRGYEETTLAQIGEQAQVAARTVSNYFPQKVDLLVAYRESMLEVFEESLSHGRDADPLRRVRSALLAVARENQRQPNGRLAQRLLARHGSYRTLGKMQRRFEDRLAAALAEAPLAPGTDLELAVLSLSAAHLAVIQRWAGQEKGSLTGPVGRLFDQWLNGLRQEPT
jgi:AcrR family transcriptional regulator